MGLRGRGVTKRQKRTIFQRRLRSKHNGIQWNIKGLTWSQNNERFGYQTDWEISQQELEDLVCDTKKFDLYPAGQEEPGRVSNRCDIIKIASQKGQSCRYSGDGNNMINLEISEKIVVTRVVACRTFFFFFGIVAFSKIFLPLFFYALLPEDPCYQTTLTSAEVSLSLHQCFTGLSSLVITPLIIILLISPSVFILPAQ